MNLKKRKQSSEKKGREFPAEFVSFLLVQTSKDLILSK